MPIASQWVDGGFEYRLSGRVTAEEVRDCVFSYSADSRSDEARFKLIDLREIDSVDVTLEELERIGAFEYGQSLAAPRLRLAFVSDGRFDGEVAAFTDLLKDGPWEVRIFADRAPAEAWTRRRVHAT